MSPRVQGAFRIAPGHPSTNTIVLDDGSSWGADFDLGGDPDDEANWVDDGDETIYQANPLTDEEYAVRVSNQELVDSLRARADEFDQ